MICYEIAEIGFAFDTDKTLKENDFYSRFRIDDKKFAAMSEKHFFNIEKESVENTISENAIFIGCGYSVHKLNNGYAKLTKRFNTRNYECICCQSGEGGSIAFTNNGYELLETAPELFRLIDLVTALLHFDALILHASVIEHNNKCIIFSGDSGVGKSTQADLWNKYTDARTLNGDRVILRKKDGEWFAYGIPMSGSSDDCECFKLPIEAIVFLGQSDRITISEPTNIEKFLLLTSQISCGSRKENESIKLMDLTEELASSLQIIKLDCTPDEKSVRYLEKYLSDR